MAILQVYAAVHISGAQYRPFTGQLKVGEYVKVVGYVDPKWMATNGVKQGCIRITDLDGVTSLRWGKTELSTTDICGYNRDRKATVGGNLFVVFVYAAEKHLENGIRLEFRCVNPASGETKYVVIPVIKG